MRMGSTTSQLTFHSILSGEERRIGGFMPRKRCAVRPRVDTAGKNGNHQL